MADTTTAAISGEKAAEESHESTGTGDGAGTAEAEVEVEVEAVPSDKGIAAPAPAPAAISFETWPIVEKWQDEQDEDPIDFQDTIKDIAENVALHDFSILCRDDIGFEKNDDPRLRDAHFNINAEDEIEELEGLLGLVLGKETLSGNLKNVLYGFCIGLEKGWSLFVKPSLETEKKQKPRHANLLDWQFDERLKSSFVPQLGNALKHVVLACEESGQIPPQDFVRFVAKFQHFETLLENKDLKIWKIALGEREAMEQERLAQLEEEKKQQAALDLLKQTKSPGVDCCYTCLGEYDPTCNWTDDIPGYIYTKVDEGFRYENARTIKKIFFCEPCYDKFLDDSDDDSDDE